MEVRRALPIASPSRYDRIVLAGGLGPVGRPFGRASHRVSVWYNASFGMGGGQTCAAVSLD